MISKIRELWEKMFGKPKYLDIRPILELEKRGVKVILK